MGAIQWFFDVADKLKFRMIEIHGIGSMFSFSIGAVSIVE